jgi:hypothetical protein
LARLKWRLVTRLFGLGLYLSRKFADIDDPAKREEFLKAVVHGSAASLGKRQPFGRIRSVGGKIQRLGRALSGYLLTFYTNAFVDLV